MRLIESNFHKNRFSDEVIMKSVLIYFAFFAKGPNSATKGTVIMLCQDCDIRDSHLVLSCSRSPWYNYAYVVLTVGTIQLLRLINLKD